MKSGKSVNLFGVFSIASGAMISSGIFILPSLVYSRVGQAVPLVYLLAGTLASIGILSVIELATAMPKAGGDYFFVNKTFGPLLGTVSGILGWIALSLKSAFAIFGLAEFAELAWNWSYPLTAVGLCLVFTVLNLAGAQGAAGVQIALVIALLGLMIAYSAAGLPFVTSAHIRIPKGSTFRDVFVSAGFVFISFGGLLKVANLSEEIANPKQNIPVGMLASIGIVTVLYTLITLVAVATLDGPAFIASLRPIADSARAFLGEAGFHAMNAAALLAFATTANAGILAASRYPLALSRDGLLPAFFGNSNPQSGTPAVAILCTGAFVLLSLLLPLETLVKAASTVVLTSYVLTNLAVIVLRESGIASYRPSFRTPFYPWIQLGSIVVFSYFIVSLGAETIEISFAFLLVGFCAYYFFGKNHEGREYALLHVLRRIADKRIIGNALETELIDIVIRRDNIEQDAFDELVKTAEIIDMDRAAPFERVAGKISRKVADLYGLDADSVLAEFLRRQRETNTALTEFLAIPHIVIDGESRMFLFIVRNARGIRFTHAQGAVKAAFFLGGSQDNRLLHLKSIAAIAMLAEEGGFEDRWLSASSVSELRNALLMSERKRLT